MNEDSSSRQPLSLQQNGNGADPESSLSRARPDSQAKNSVAKNVREMAQKLFRRNGDNSMREAIEELIEEKVGDETPIETEERNLLANILSLRDRTISDVMVPRADIVAIDIGAPIDDLISLINRGGHSRIPVFQKTLDDAVGMVHIKDVLAARNSALQKDQLLNLKNIIREVLFVAPSMQVLELLLEMRVKRIHMALVVDEYGGVDGLLTIEDLVEEIVGEIEDEHDQEEVPVLKLQSDGSLIADARVLIESFENLAGNILGEEEREEIETLGGLVVSLAGRVPIRGELVNHPSGMEIEVMEADPRRIKKLHIRGVAISDLETGRLASPSIDGS